MNPLQWPRHAQIGLLVAIAVGAALGVLVGFFVANAGTGAEGGISFRYWLRSRYGYPYPWAAFGAAIGAGVVFIRRTTG